MVCWLKDHHFSFERFSNKLHMETTMELSTGRRAEWSGMEHVVPLCCRHLLSSSRVLFSSCWRQIQGYENKVAVLWQTALYIARLFHDVLHHRLYHLDLRYLHGTWCTSSKVCFISWCHCWLVRWYNNDKYQSLFDLSRHSEVTGVDCSVETYLELNIHINKWVTI